jgi:23S rRNA (adenine2503-C2)-methyltransferase
MDCAFCATGQGGFARNLSTGEIVAQVLFYARSLAEQGERVTNVVLMGMGEPLANYAATWAAIRRLNDPTGFGLGARAMILSTVGLVPAIRRMSREPEQVGLAVSLHAPTDELRNRLVPINRRYGLQALLDACREYITATRRRVSFEYALIEGVNDSNDQARQLASLVGDMLAHINLIPLNPTSASSFRESSPAKVRAFQQILRRQGVPNTVRLRRGIDIQAGCGQLRAHYKAK